MRYSYKYYIGISIHTRLCFIHFYFKKRPPISIIDDFIILTSLYAILLNLSNSSCPAVSDSMTLYSKSLIGIVIEYTSNL